MKTKCKMKTISPHQLLLKLQRNDDIVLIDVRTPEEHQAFNIGGILMPLNELELHHPIFQSEKEIIVYCKKGIRSMIAIQRLENKYNINNLYNLIGGIEAWKKHVNEDK